jgi:mannitol-1-phosphate 5-dehydrogenase
MASDSSQGSLLYRLFAKFYNYFAWIFRFWRQKKQTIKPKTTMKAVHFGGGNIGRGFVAEFLHKSGYEVVFADVQDQLINEFQRRPSYTVTEVGTEETRSFEITNYRAINSKDNEADVVKELSTADLVTCAVGPNILKFIAPVIAKGIDARDESLKPIAVIACENAIGATDTLKEFIVEKHTAGDRRGSVHVRAQFANSAIDRIVPEQEKDAGLDVKLEKYYEWVVEKTPFALGGPPKIDGVKWVDNLEPYIERKLYTVNTGHASAAYYGYVRGKPTIHDALSDKAINELVHGILKETASLIVAKHGISEQEQQQYVEKIISRISNPHLGDAVERVGRAPLRKVSRKERFIGPAAQLAERKMSYSALLGGFEQALRFQNVEGDDESKELAKILKDESAESATIKLTGLEKSHPLFPAALKVVDKVKRDPKSKV